MIEGQSAWVLSPAYDLLNVGLALPSDQDDVALSLSGKKKLTRNSFINPGIGMGLNEREIEGVFKRFGEKKGQAIDLLNLSFLSAEMKEQDYISINEAIQIYYEKNNNRIRPGRSRT